MTDPRSANSNNALTSPEHWDAVHPDLQSARMPSRLNVSFRNAARVLRPEIRAGARVLEIGFAPGKLLAWVAKGLGGEVSGVDTSRKGVGAARSLFAALGVPGDLRNEDVFDTSFPLGSFDVVYSLGVIEHFRDARPLVRRHVELARPGGVVVLTVPNYRGIYGSIQRALDAPNIDLHNLDIMTRSALEEPAPADLASEARAWRTGRVDPWLLSLSRKIPARAARLLAYAVNGLGVVQWPEIGPLCPLLALRIVRRSA